VPDPIELTAVPFEQNGVMAFMGVATAGALDSICSVPWMNPQSKSKDFANDILNGTMDENQWQRMVDHTRVNDIRNFSEQEDKNLFNPILLYVDNKHVKITGKEKEKKISVPFDFLKEHLGAFTDYFPKPEEIDHRPVWIIDGQHRVRGFGSSKRGSRLPIPFVLLTGDGDPEQLAEVALLFTQINTTSKPLDDLHKMYLNYQFCVADGISNYGVKLDNSGEKIIGTYGLPEPTDEGRISRRTYELALWLAAHSESPVLDCVIFQQPPNLKPPNKMVYDAKKFDAATASWFASGIYRDKETDEFANDEVLNFLKALHTNCNNWPDGVLRWVTGKGNGKNFLQGRGPFRIVLDTHRFCTERILESEPKISRPISVERYMEEMAPIRWVDWSATSLKKSGLQGQKNENIRHVNLWIKTAIENGIAFDTEDILNPELESVPGKGLIANPKAIDPVKTSDIDFPGITTLNLEVEIPIHCLSVNWEIEGSVDGDKWKDIEIPGDAIGNTGSRKTIAIRGAHISPNQYLRIRAKFTNGIGSTYSEWVTYSSPSV